VTLIGSHQYTVLNTDHTLVKTGCYMQPNSVSHTKAVYLYAVLHHCSVASVV